MKIAIIGAGSIGGNLTRRLTALGHDVSVANSRGPHTLTELAAETGATAVEASSAANGADIVIVTVPQKSVPDLPAGLTAGAAEDAAVIDTCNYYPKERDGYIAAIEAGATESEWVQSFLDRPVVKVFNGIYAQHLVDRHLPAGTPARIALPVAGDDAAAKAKVMQLVDELGFEPVDAGSLAGSWRMQPGTPVYGADADADGVRKALAAASPERPENFRA